MATKKTEKPKKRYFFVLILGLIILGGVGYYLLKENSDISIPKIDISLIPFQSSKTENPLVEKEKQLKKDLQQIKEKQKKELASRKKELKDLENKLKKLSGKNGY